MSDRSTGMLCEAEKSALLVIDVQTHLTAIILDTESVLFEWMRDAKNEHFKTLQTLLR